MFQDLSLVVTAAVDVPSRTSIEMSRLIAASRPRSVAA